MIEKPMRFFLKTMGCQMNVADSDFIGAHLCGLGMKQVEDLEMADIVLLNTCTVRQQAENKALSFIGRLKKLKDRKKQLKIVFAGCAAQRLGEKLKKQLPIIDLVIGAKSIEHFPAVFDKFMDINDNNSGEAARGINAQSGSAVSTFVTIMRGCENFCSYCIVPYVRGKERSRAPQDIISEISSLVKSGVKDLTLLGQNVNSYAGISAKNKETLDFAGLLEQVNQVDGLKRIRFMTSHPKDLSDKLIDAVATLDKACEHIHLPIQSGSDKILKAMNRGYTSSEYLSRIEKIKSKTPKISLTTDLLIGFPGESDADFNKTLDIIKQVDFDFLFAFKYSPRPGTPAQGFGDDIPQEVIEKRHAKVLDAAYGISAQKNAKLIGFTQQVLVEEKRDGQCVGFSRQNKRVFFDSDDDLTGRLVDVKITASKINSLTGTAEKVL